MSPLPLIWAGWRVVRRESKGDTDMRAFTATMAFAGILAIGLCGCSAEDKAAEDGADPAAETEVDAEKETGCADCKAAKEGGPACTA